MSEREKMVDNQIELAKASITAEDQEYFTAFGPKVVLAVTRVPPDIRAMSVYELEAHFRPSYQHYQFKVSFWKTYTRCLELGVKFDIKDAIRMARANGYFFSKIIDNPYGLWWLMSPIATYEQQIEAMMYKAMQRRDEILDLPNFTDVVSKDGEIRKVVNNQLINLKLKAISDIEDRTVGPVEQRISQKTQKIPSNIPRNGPGPDTIDLELKQLEDKLGKSTEASKV